MTSRREFKFSRQSRGYIAAFLVSLPFWAAIVLVILVLAQRGVCLSFLSWLFFVGFPLSPLFVVWLYFLYKALIPVTGGMPARGFKQWALAYGWGIALLLYWALWAFIFDMTVPSIDTESREFFLPLVISYRYTTGSFKEHKIPGIYETYISDCHK